MALAISFGSGFARAEDEPHPEGKPQYEFEDNSIVAATADEPILEKWSAEKAAEYLEAGATLWAKQKNCISCHTNGSYMVLRPALTNVLGKPSQEVHDFYLTKLEKRLQDDMKELTRGVTPIELAYIAAGLAEWDAHVTGNLSEETNQAISLMFRTQSEDGSFSNDDCWPPYESDDFHGATIAAMAVATAPGYLDSLEGDAKRGYEELIGYLKSEEPPHDYSRLLLLLTSTRVEGLIDETQKQEIIDIIFGHQQEDGGWSIRTFADPEDWGSGNRADKLYEEEDIDNPASDGHQTGLAIVALRDAGIAADDARIMRGVEWLKKNQRVSGRWWTRSLNNDKFHFITFSGTCYPLLALAKTNQIPASASE